MKICHSCGLLVGVGIIVRLLVLVSLVLFLGNNWFYIGFGFLSMYWWTALTCGLDSGTFVTWGVKSAIFFNVGFEDLSWLWILVYHSSSWKIEFIVVRVWAFTAHEICNRQLSQVFGSLVPSFECIISSCFEWNNLYFLK